MHRPVYATSVSWITWSRWTRPTTSWKRSSPAYSSQHPHSPPPDTHQSIARKVCLRVSIITLTFRMNRPEHYEAMCGRYTLYDTKDMGPRFDLKRQPHFVSKDNYNVAPRQWLPIIFEDP